METQIGIIGYGQVGKHVNKLFSSAIIFDPALGFGAHSELKKCSAVFVCVPTPQNEDGSCDTSIVESVIANIDFDPLIIIRSTVPVGFSKYLAVKYSRRIVFCPEYFGETVGHNYALQTSIDWTTIGGVTPSASSACVAIFKNVVSADHKFFITDSNTAELAKYMCNAFLAMKVTFCNLFFDIAKEFEVDYDVLREAFLMDKRIGRSHTLVYENDRGFSGKCLPKDLAAIVNLCNKHNINCGLLETVLMENGKYFCSEK